MGEVTVTWELEITSKIPVSKVFHDFVLRYLEFVAKNVIPEQFMPAITTLEGDGGAGTIKEIISGNDMFGGIRYKVTALDLENLSCTYAFCGNVINLNEMKVIPLANGGCTFKNKKTDYQELSEDGINAQKEQFIGEFNIFEAIVAQDSDDQ